MIWKYADGIQQAKNHYMKNLKKNSIKTAGSHVLEMTMEYTIRLHLENQ